MEQCCHVKPRAQRSWLGLRDERPFSHLPLRGCGVQARLDASTPRAHPAPLIPAAYRGEWGLGGEGSRSISGEVVVDLTLERVGRGRGRGSRDEKYSQCRGSGEGKERGEQIAW